MMPTKKLTSSILPCYPSACLLILSLQVLALRLDPRSRPCREVPIKIPADPPVLSIFHFHFFDFPVLPKLFRINTYEISRKCCKQRTCRIAKSFRCNTYEKTGGRGCYG